MERTIEIIKKFFEENELKYRYEESDKAFITGFDMGNVLGDTKVYIFLEREYYLVYVVLNSSVEEKYNSNVGEFLHRANYGINNGNFEIDYRDGEVRYKTFVSFKNMKLSDEVIEESIMAALATVNRYGKGLIKTMLGEGTPENNIMECEKQLGD